MIDWLSAAELRQQLQSYAPIGLWLHDWFHARTDVDPGATIASRPETHFDEGLGDAHVWSGVVDAMPFAIRSMPNPGGGFGFEILFPVLRQGDRTYLDALAQIMGQLPSWRSPYFSQLPIAGGFAVVGADDTPIYTSVAGHDAIAVAAFVNHAVPPPCRVLPIGASARRWLVVGPGTGPYVSRVESYSNEPEAKRCAARWAAETGATFDVRREP